MKIGIITIFPEMFFSFMDYGITNRALKKNLLTLKFLNPRNFSSDKRKKIDSKIYGGGSGMLMTIQPIKDAIHQAKIYIGNFSKVIYLSPQGDKLCQSKVMKFLDYSNIIIVCGRYKGIDERLIISEIDEEVSIGDYVISGGELGAMILIDSISRVIPGVIKKKIHI